MYLDKKYMVEPYFTWKEGSEIPETLLTKWGTAKVNDDGYWVISSVDKGCCNKYVDRLVYEAEHGLILSSSDIVHHIDGDKLNCYIENLGLLPYEEHAKKGLNVMKKFLPKVEYGELNYITFESNKRKRSISEETIKEFFMNFRNEKNIGDCFYDLE